MEATYPKISVLIMDYGSQVKFAQAMTKYFGSVFYHNPYVHDGFQEVRDINVAEGIPNIVKVKEWASIIEAVQYVVFTDCYEPELQDYFRSIGKYVFGSGMSASLETDRKFLKTTMEFMGLPMAKYEIAVGVDYLEYLLKEKSDVFIKSNNRGNFETTQWKNYKLSKGELRRIRKEMGVFGDREEYIIEDKIQSIGEIGIDTFCINGDYPDTVLTGIEVKDLGYVGMYMGYRELPKQLKSVTDKLSPVFREFGYRGCHSNEVIIGKDMEGYLIDLTCRMPQPPGDAMVMSISNYGDCLMQVAQGMVPLVRPEYKYVCQFILKSDIAQIDDTPIIVPDQYKKFVSVKNLYIDSDGTWYYARRGLKMSEIGSVVGMGETLKQAIDMASEIANSIEAEDAHVELGCINDGLESLQRLKQAGIKYFS